MQLISVVIPAHNEQGGIAHSLDVIAGVLGECGIVWEIVVVDDGSIDGTFTRVQERAARDPRIKGIRFSRNFGKEAAIFAGLVAARGDAVITIDADLQHPPQLIPSMIDSWREGAKVVDAVKRSRATDGPITRARARIFNTILSAVAGINLENASDYKLLDKSIVATITRALPERHRFYRGLSEWVGYQHVTIRFDVEARAAGTGKWSLWRLVELAMTAVISFTSAPLRIVTIMGVATLILGILVGSEALLRWLQGIAVSGFSTIIFTLLIIGSFIMISLGVIGEYIAKIYDEIKARPVYLIEKQVNIETDVDVGPR